MQPVPSTYIEGTVSHIKTAAPKKSSLSFPVIIGLFLLSILIGGGATLGILVANGTQLFGTPPPQPAVRLPTPSASSTPGATPTTQAGQLPTPTSFQTATSAALGITLQFPGDWVQDPPQQSSAGNTFVIFHPQQQLPVAFDVGRLSTTNSSSVTSTTEINQANVQGFGSSNNLTNMHLLTNTPQHRTIGGVSWDEMDVTYSTSSNTDFHLVSISVKHNNLYYNILFYAPSSAYDEAVQKYYSQMLSTFKFTS